MYLLITARTHTVQNITFTVAAEDNGHPETFVATAEVTITVVSPDNFFNPELDQMNYVATLDENEPSNTTVLRFTVTDDDTVGPASEIGVATITGIGSELFTVVKTGPNSGEIRSK